MKAVTIITFVALNIIGLNSFLIVPDEIPTVLSVIYSNIPTFKKGTDSRIGWGFRFGDRADFQVMVELGPQTYTQPLANQGSDNANKRNTINNLANALYAQRQQEKKNLQETDSVNNFPNILKVHSPKQKINQEEKEKESSNSEADKWLQSWSKTVSSKEADNQAIPPQAKPGIAIGEIDAKSVFPDDSDIEENEKAKIAAHKKQVKKPNHKKPDPERRLISILTESDQPQAKETFTEKEKPLDDVSLD